VYRAHELMKMRVLGMTSRFGVPAPGGFRCCCGRNRLKRQKWSAVFAADNNKVMRGCIVFTRPGVIYKQIGRQGGPPSPDTPPPVRSLCELRQQLWNPKRVNGLGFFFVAGSGLIHGLHYCAWQ
jgi:hypothetical protein